MNNTFGITASVQFDGNATGQSGGSGIYCATVTTSVTSGKSDYKHQFVQPMKLKLENWMKHLTSFGENFEATGSAENINGYICSYNWLFS